MALYEQKWWKKLFKDKRKKKKVNSLQDIQIIKEFLTDIQYETRLIISELSKLEELEKERKVAKPGIIQINLETQAELLDKLLKKYQFFSEDVNINGVRIKMIAQELLNKAKKAGLNDLIKDKKTNWKFKW